MPLANGRHTLAIPGPSIIPDRVLQAMHRPSPNIYTGELIEMTATIIPDLKAVARTQGGVAMYIGNGHAAWEACLSNTHARGDLTLIPATGFFAHGWGRHAKGLGIEVETLEFGGHDPIDPERVAARLRADTGHKIRSVLVVQSDTSTGILSDVAALGAAMRETGHPALLMVDCMASLGCDRMEMDAWGVDVVIAGCQKGLMTPAGMAFVFVSERARQARARADLATPYWDWNPRIAPEMFYAHWCGTAPTHHLYGLRTALDMIVHEEGLEAVWARHDQLARALWAACDVWAEGGALSFNVADVAARSRAVTLLQLPAPLGTKLRQYLETQLGVTLGIGLGMIERGDSAPDAYFRVGHMGHLNAHGMMGTLGAMETGLRALGVPIGAGGLSAAAAVLAEG